MLLFGTTYVLCAHKQGGIIRRGVVFLLKNIDWEVVSRWGVNAQ